MDGLKESKHYSVIPSGPIPYKLYDLVLNFMDSVEENSTAVQRPTITVTTSTTTGCASTSDDAHTICSISSNINNVCNHFSNNSAVYASSASSTSASRKFPTEGLNLVLTQHQNTVTGVLESNSKFLESYATDGDCDSCTNEINSHGATQKKENSKAAEQTVINIKRISCTNSNYLAGGSSDSLCPESAVKKPMDAGKSEDVLSEATLDSRDLLLAPSICRSKIKEALPGRKSVKLKSATTEENQRLSPESLKRDGFCVTRSEPAREIDLPQIEETHMFFQFQELQARFGELASKMYLQTNGNVISLMSKRSAKEIVPIEGAGILVMQIHTLNGQPGVFHLTPVATITAYRLRYTFGEDDFGITEDFVRRIIMQCSDDSCLAKDNLDKHNEYSIAQASLPDHWPVDHFYQGIYTKKNDIKY